MIARRFLGRLRDDCSGSVLIETAIIAPVLIMMALAGVEVSQSVLRQHELQANADKVTQIVLAAPPKTSEDLQKIKDFVVANGKLKAADVTVNFVWRCNGTGSFRSDNSGCIDKPKATKYVSVLMIDSYEPIWASLGYGEPMTFRMRRTIQLS